MSVQEIVDRAIEEKKIVIFSKTWCQFCARTKALFAQEFPEETPYILELDKRDDGDAIQDYLAEKTNQRSVPNVFVKGQHVGGNDKTQLAFKEGKLVTMVNL